MTQVQEIAASKLFRGYTITADILCYIEENPKITIEELKITLRRRLGFLHKSHESLKKHGGIAIDEIYPEYPEFFNGEFLNEDENENKKTN